jgi:hypothetical protein
VIARLAVTRAVVAVALGVAVLGWSAPAGAQVRCPLPDTASSALGGVQPARRLSWISGRLTHAEKNARLWTFGWGGGIAAAGVGSLVAVPFVASGDRVDWYTGAVSAGVGVAAFVFAPPAILHDAPALRADLARPRSQADLCALLASAEARLVHDARDEEQQGRWYIHVGNLVFNAGLGLFLGLGYHHWSGGIINAVSGAAVGEAIIFTRPTASIGDLGSYLRGTF